MVDEKKTGIFIGVDLSFLSKKSQRDVADAIEKVSALSMGQSAKLKEYEKKNELTTTVVRLILEEKNVHKRKVTLKMDKLSQYFDDRYSSGDGKHYSSSVRGMEEDTGGHTVMEEGLKFDYYYGVQSNSFHSIDSEIANKKISILKACPVMQSFVWTYVRQNGSFNEESLVG